MLRAKLIEIRHLTSLNSRVFSDYFHQLMQDHNIKTIRNGMKVLIFYCYFEIISSQMSEMGIIFRPIIALIMFCVYFLFFILTINAKEMNIMVRFSSIMVVMGMIYTVLVGTDTREVMETHYSLVISIILIMFTLFQYKFTVTMLLSMVFILIFVTIGNYRLKFIRRVNISALDEPLLSQQRAFHLKMNNTFTYICGQGILFILLYCTGLYLRFFNSIRKKSTFLKLAENVKAKISMESALKSQGFWIGTIVPSVLREEYINKRGQSKAFDLAYCKKYENVSILFGDIAGFTEMSMKKTAEKLVFLLNDLYSRFDKFTKKTNCERIGTCGDCYYCVSGCPVSNSDHAKCCISMGLAMCREILDFNKIHREKLNMRVGVHSGIVMAAIIGNQRFRFDLFSNDVIVANSLKSNGKPGWVHISEDTHKCVKDIYSFENGDLMKIKREKENDISSQIEIKTYYVKGKAEKLDSIENPTTVIKENNIKEYTQILSNESKYSSKTLSSDIKKYFTAPFQNNSNSLHKDVKLEEDINLIRILQNDPENPANLFRDPPLNRYLLTFFDKEIEYQYLYNTTDQVEILYIDSIKTALLFDSLACLFFSTILLGTGYLMIPNDLLYIISLPICYLGGVILAIIAIFISILYESEINNIFFRKIFSFFSHPISRSFLSISISSLPSILVLSLYSPKELHVNYQYTSTYFTFALFALVGNSLSTTPYSIIKLISTGIFTIIFIWILIDPFSSTYYESTYYKSCTISEKYFIESGKSRLQCHFLFQLIYIFILLYYLTRENEKNLRINFYATREANIRKGEERRVTKVAEDLLLNIIPKHVLIKISRSNTDDGRYTYANDIPKAGVMFACISNFFSTYFRENYKNGEIGLKLLHTIICTFDNLLKNLAYKEIEKIKTINDCYMVASGLDTENGESDNDDHLVVLMNYALDMHYHLHLFNKEKIIGFSGFTIKIGYNFGPVTAGIIGVSKPLFDIWGDTVNVASQMYTTASPGNIQVPDYVVKQLEGKFEFKYCGEVANKEKGKIITYLVLKSYEKPHLFLGKED